MGYAYNLSKRTSVYTAASYMRDDVNKELAGTTSDINPSSVEVAAGLIHKFQSAYRSRRFLIGKFAKAFLSI